MFEPSSIRWKYRPPGASRYANMSRPCRNIHENDDGKNKVDSSLPKIRSVKTTSLWHNGNVIYRWIVIVVILLITIPLVSSAPDDDGANVAERLMQQWAPVAAAIASAVHGDELEEADDNGGSTTPPPPKKTKRQPPKRKKSRLCKKKKSTYQYSAVKEQLGLERTARPQEVLSATRPRGSNTSDNTPPSQRSPLKAAVKRQNKMLIEKVEAHEQELKELRDLTAVARGKLEEQDSQLKVHKDEVKSLERSNKRLKKDSEKLQVMKKERLADKRLLKERLRTIKSLEEDNERIDALLRKGEADQKVIDQLRENNAALSQLLKDEKAASRATIAKVTGDAEALMAEANTVMKDAQKKKRDIEKAEKELVREERRWSARQAARVTSKKEQEIAKLNEEYETILRLQEAKYNTLRQRLNESREKVAEEKAKWQGKLDKLNTEVAAAHDRAYREKKKRRDAVSEQVNKARAKERELQNYIDGLVEENEGLVQGCIDAMRDKEAAEYHSTVAKNLARKRLEKWHAEREARREAEDELAKQSKILSVTEELIASYQEAADASQDTKRQMKKEWLDETSKSKRGGRKSWPVWVVQLICELLVNGNSPTSIPGTIEIMYETLYGEKPDDLPSINFVRECRPIVEVIGETIAALKLADAETWDQLWTDGTTRRQIPFTALIIGVIGDSDKIDPVVVSSCIFMEDETAETQADGIVSKINSLKHRLFRVRQVMEDTNPGSSQEIPSEDGIDINKLGKGGTMTTDTCNTAQKLRRILIDKIPGSFDFDCMHHLRNIWFGNMEKKLTKALNLLLRTSLDEIDPKLRVTASVSAIIRAVDKEFSLSANYPKGHGELFLEWMREKHPGELLLHVERASGSRQDLCTEGSMAILMNYPYYVEFLDSMLRKRRKKNQKPSILQQNLFVALTSSEMIALVRLLSILHISVCMPFRWLAGKSHELKHRNWGPMSMGRVLDTLESKMQRIADDPSLILDEEFMMNIYRDYLDELPEFQKYWDMTFKKKQMKVVARKSGSKVVHFARLRNMLFSPGRKTVRDTKTRVIELAETAAEAILTELHDDKKATYKYLSCSDSEYCWKNCTEERKSALLGNKATNDEAESTLGGTTYQLQKHGRINLTNAAAVSDMKRNAFLHRQTKSKTDKKPTGIFHAYSQDLQYAIVRVAMMDAKLTVAAHQEELELQAKARREKEELARQKNIDNATEEFIEAECLIKMYHSEAGIKGDAKNVTAVLKSLPTQTAKYEALKQNILMRVRGFGWEWAKHAWSKNGKKYSIKDLAKHLRWVIQQEKKRKVAIPSEPKPTVAKRVALPVLGTQTELVGELDKKYMADEDEFKKSAARLSKKRETMGETSIYSRLQPFYRPEISELKDRRIDVLVSFDVKINGIDDKELRWCQGEVIHVYEDRRQPTVRVLWDEMLDVKDGDAVQTDQVLLPTKWNKDTPGAWRMDVDVEEDEEGGENDGDESEMEEDSGEDDIESESEDESDCDSDEN